MVELTLFYGAFTPNLFGFKWTLARYGLKRRAPAHFQVDSGDVCSWCESMQTHHRIFDGRYLILARSKKAKLVINPSADLLIDPCKPCAVYINANRVSSISISICEYFRSKAFESV